MVGTARFELATLRPPDECAKPGCATLRNLPQFSPRLASDTLSAQVALSGIPAKEATNPRNAVETLTSLRWWDSNPRSSECETDDLAADLHLSRSGGIRTPDNAHPKRVHYQAVLHSVFCCFLPGVSSRLAAFNPDGDAAIETEACRV